MACGSIFSMNRAGIMGGARLIDCDLTFDADSVHSYMSGEN
jgi:hypothetical protein